MNRVGDICGIGLILLGVFHLAMTTANYDLGSVEALWFSGAGTMLVAAGALVVAAARSAVLIVPLSAAAVSFLGMLLSIWAISLIDEPQSYILALLFVGAFLATVRNVMTVRASAGRTGSRVSSIWRQKQD